MLSSTEPWDRPRFEQREGSWWAPRVSTHLAPSKFHRSVLTLFSDVEWTPTHTRACVGTLIGYVYSLGQFLLAGVAYAVPHWRYLQLLVSVPFFAFFIYSWCVGPRGLRGTRLPPDLAHRIREGPTQASDSV